MSKTTSLRGMLLEELLLALLQDSGYVPILDPAHDPDSLGGAVGFLKVRGRGEQHQIDVVADFGIEVPFTNPLRLLLEAKCFSSHYPTSLAVVRNAVGVLKDVSEFWTANTLGEVVRNRYHYQYAICSASGYTADAQAYAYAQDIFLLQIPEDSFLSNLVDHVRRTRYEDLSVEWLEEHEHWLRSLRVLVRMWLERVRSRGQIDDVQRQVAETFGEPAVYRELMALIAHSANCALTYLDGRFPILLVPVDPAVYAEIGAEIQIRIRYDRQNLRTWRIENVYNRPLFTFSLPAVLLQKYLDGQGQFAPDRALDLKEVLLGKLQLLRVSDNVVRITTLRLDGAWINEIREYLHRIADNGPREGADGQ